LIVFVFSRSSPATTTELLLGFEAGSSLRLIDFVYLSTTGLRVIKKEKKKK